MSKRKKAQKSRRAMPMPSTSSAVHSMWAAEADLATLLPETTLYVAPSGGYIVEDDFPAFLESMTEYLGPSGADEVDAMVRAGFLRKLTVGEALDVIDRRARGMRPSVDATQAPRPPAPRMPARAQAHSPQASRAASLIATALRKARIRTPVS